MKNLGIIIPGIIGAGCFLYALYLLGAIQEDRRTAGRDRFRRLPAARVRVRKHPGGKHTPNV